MSYLSKFAARIGIAGGSGRRRKLDESTSNSSLSNMRYVLTEKPKWKVFRKKELVPIPVYSTRKSAKGCPCGSNGPCKQKITPKGVTIHYPQKRRTGFPSFSSKKILKPKSERGLIHSSPPKGSNKVKTIKLKKFPTFRMDKISYR